MAFVPAWLNGANEAQANSQAYDAAARERLRRLSLELTGRLDPALPALWLAKR